MSRNNLTVDRENRSVSMWRIIHAPLDRVWQAHSDPTIIPKWWGPRKYETIVEEMDFRVGGKWRYINKSVDGSQFAFYGEYLEITPQQKITWTFEFELMAGHVATETVSFDDLGDGTTKISTISVALSLEDLDGVLQSGMEEGAVETWDRLEEITSES